MKIKIFELAKHRTFDKDLNQVIEFADGRKLFIDKKHNVSTFGSAICVECNEENEKYYAIIDKMGNREIVENKDGNLTCKVSYGDCYCFGDNSNTIIITSYLHRIEGPFDKDKFLVLNELNQAYNQFATGEIELSDLPEKYFQNNRFAEAIKRELEIRYLYTSRKLHPFTYKQQELRQKATDKILLVDELQRISRQI